MYLNKWIFLEAKIKISKITESCNDQNLQRVGMLEGSECTVYQLDSKY